METVADALTRARIVVCAVLNEAVLRGYEHVFPLLSDANALYRVFWLCNTKATACAKAKQLIIGDQARANVHWLDELETEYQMDKFLWEGHNQLLTITAKELVTNFTNHLVLQIPLRLLKYIVARLKILSTTFSNSRLKYTLADRILEALPLGHAPKIPKFLQKRKNTLRGLAAIELVKRIWSDVQRLVGGLSLDDIKSDGRAWKLLIELHRISDTMSLPAFNIIPQPGFTRAYMDMDTRVLLKLVQLLDDDARHLPQDESGWDFDVSDGMDVYWIKLFWKTWFDLDKVDADCFRCHISTDGVGASLLFSKYRKEKPKPAE